MSTTPANPSTTALSGYFADLYTFDWTGFSFRIPLICAIAIALCLVIGVLVGHPSAGLIAGGGAMTVGFGINQRIADSRLWPMIAATFTMFVSTLVGMSVGHGSFILLLVTAIWSFVYGLLTARAAGVSWVGQQAAVTLLVASAFPAGPHAAFLRALLILAGGSLQILITSLFLHLLPELKAHILTLPEIGNQGVSELSHQFNRRRVLRRLRGIPKVLPRLSHAASVTYAARLAITVTIGAEVYRHLGIQSGYWIPMTALLVQKPAFFETLNRALLRVAGTLVGAVASTFFLIHIHPDPLYLAILATLCALLSYCTNTVNYGLFSLFITSYIVFLLSLNQLPGPVIAHRRALCTITGGLIALLIHLDALRRHRNNPTAT